MGLFQDYMSARIIASDPALMGAYMEDRDTARTAKHAVGLMGEPEQLEAMPYTPDYMAGEELPPEGNLMYTGNITPASGLFAGANEEQTKMLEFNKKALQSDSPDLQKMAINNLQSYQNTAMDPTGSSRGFGAGRYIFEDEDKNQWWVGNVTDKTTGQMDTVYSPVDPSLQGQDPRGKLQMVDRTYGMTGTDKVQFEADKASAVEEAEKRTQNEVNFFLDYVPRTMAIEDAIFNIETTQDFMHELAGITGYDTAGFGGWLRAIPLTDANRWRELASTITGRLAMDKLQELKTSSAVGASGLGALSEKELKLLQDYYGNIAQSQDPKVIKHNLEQIYKQLEYTKNRQRSKMMHNLEKYEKVHKKWGRNQPMPTFVQQHRTKIRGIGTPAGERSTEAPKGASWNDLPDQ